MYLLTNTNADKTITVDRFGSTKKIEKVIVRVMPKGNTINVTGNGLVYDDDSKRDVAIHTFNFGTLSQFNQSNFAQKVKEVALSALPEGFEIVE